MANRITEAIKERHILSQLEKTVKKGSINAFCDIVMSYSLDITTPNILSKLCEIIIKRHKFIESSEMLQIRRLLRKHPQTILNNQLLKEIFLDFFVADIRREKQLNYEDIVSEPELFEELIKDEQFKGEFTEKINIQKLGEELVNYSFLVRVEPDTIEHSKNCLSILKQLGFTLNEDKKKELMLESEGTQRGLLFLNLIDQSDMAKLFTYKFEKLKEWVKDGAQGPMPKIPLNYYIYTPSPEYPMANYWYEMYQKTGMDAMEFVLNQIKEAEGLDIFGEGRTKDLYERWKKEGKGQYYPDPYFTEKERKKMFFSELDKNLGRLFTREGLPTKLLFTNNNYNQHMLHDITYYNWHGGAHERNRYSTYTYLRDLILFFLANKDKIPAEYLFIFEKIEEFFKIENPFERDRVIEDFLLFMTDGERIIEGNRLYDENGFNSNFYTALLWNGKPANIDIIEPHWREHLTPKEIWYLENNKNQQFYNFLDNIYRIEMDQFRKEHANDPEWDYDRFCEEFPPSMGIRDLIDRYYSDKGPNRRYITTILGNVWYRKTLFDEDQLLLLDEEKAYLTFLKENGNDNKINIPVKEIKKYFDSNGPKAEFSKYLYNLQQLELIAKYKLDYKNIFNKKDTKIMDEYIAIEDYRLRTVFQKFVFDNYDDLTDERIDIASILIQRISKSNSTELLVLREQIALQLLYTDEPLMRLEKIEKVFTKNNLPTVGKIFTVFKILHPEFIGFDFKGSQTISPVLKKKGNRSREAIIFSDLLRAAFGSNNRSLINYLKTIRRGNELYKELKQTNRELTIEEQQILEQFISHMHTLYHNTLKGKNDEREFTLSGDYVKDIDKLVELLSPNGIVEYDLADRIIDMFCHFAGITSLEEAEEYMKRKVAEADIRNRATQTLQLRRGDFVKGIGDIKYLGHILQNGSVSKEHLGAYSTSDATQLDTDLSMILNPGSTILETIAGTEAYPVYGPIYFILKNDDRFTFTRRSSADPDQSIDEKPPLSKLETFYTGVCGPGHYGIRTGFASTEIDAIVVGTYDKRIGLEIALNGFYIPVFNLEGKLVFTPTDYDILRDKMRGLDYYSAEQFVTSPYLVVPGIEQIAAQIPASIDDIVRKRKAINETIQTALKPLGLTVKDHYDGDLSDGVAELIDTGSTGRFTNMPGDGDFDFMLKLDRKIIENPSKLGKVKSALLKVFNKESHDSNEVIGTGDFRLKGVKLNNLDVPVDIDITFETKTDKINYSTDESLKDRLSSIRENNPREYPLIISNILLAKKLLKHYEVYKPNRGDNPQGGLGGVGIENWILQNGGSLKTAAETFLNAAEGKTFEEFKATYIIWDFGENHLIARHDIYPHDNFVYNMSPAGFEKMKKALKAFLYAIRNAKNDVKFEDLTASMLK